MTENPKSQNLKEKLLLQQVNTKLKSKANKVNQSKVEHQGLNPAQAQAVQKDPRMECHKTRMAQLLLSRYQS